MTTINDTDRLTSRPRWHRETTHGNGCAGCRYAAESAKTEALMSRSDESTYTVTRNDEEHSATVSRARGRNT